MGTSTIEKGTRDLVAEINALRTEHGAAILAHNYQRPEIQDLADVVADSLQMARRASAMDAPVLVICGVHFMAETAAISPRAARWPPRFKPRTSAPGAPRIRAALWWRT
jgi:quinolinate synthase